MKLDKLLDRLESLAKLADLLKPLLSKLPAGTLETLVSAAVKAIDALGADALADKARAAIEKTVAKESAADPDAPAPAPAAPALDWCWGGFNGSRAAESPDARIKNLRISSGGLSYEWEKGGCEALGAKDRTDAGHTLACLFLDDGRGGKFDWISTSRTSRSFENVEGRYNGWDPAAFKASKTLRFCICSADGKLRTNLLEAKA